jgi:hypothetical protein
MKIQGGYKNFGVIIYTVYTQVKEKRSEVQGRGFRVSPSVSKYPTYVIDCRFKAREKRPHLGGIR